MHSIDFAKVFCQRLKLNHAPLFYMARPSICPQFGMLNDAIHIILSCLYRFIISVLFL
jgi:hypothetical protein